MAASAFKETNLINATSAEEIRIFDEIFSRPRTLPDGVTSVDYELREDSTGADAIWIILTGFDDLNPSKEKILAYRRLIDELKAEIRQTGTARWPFHHFVAE